MADGLATITVENNVTFKRLEDGRTEICLIADKSFGRNQYALRDSLNTAGDKLTLKLSKYRKHRSLDANRYLWVLIHQLAEEQGIDDTELYRRYIKESGLKKSDEISDEFYKTVSYVWSQRGLGWFSEKTDNGTKDGCSLYTFYYGSSCYNSRQMARLIDSVVQDCDAVGIETMPKSDIDSLVSSWKGKL